MSGCLQSDDLRHSIVVVVYCGMIMLAGRSEMTFWDGRVCLKDTIT